MKSCLLTDHRTWTQTQSAQDCLTDFRFKVRISSQLILRGKNKQNKQKNCVITTEMYFGIYGGT